MKKEFRSGDSTVISHATRRIVWGVLDCVIGLLIYAYVLQPVHLIGQAMSPTLIGQDRQHGGDYVFVDKLMYRFRQSRRGDIVEITTRGLNSPVLKPNALYIRRIVGVPGDEVTIANQKEKLGDSEYLLAGDNTDTNLPTRVIGPVNKEEILGRAVCVFFPPNRIRTLNEPFVRERGIAPSLHSDVAGLRSRSTEAGFSIDCRV